MDVKTSLQEVEENNKSSADSVKSFIKQNIKRNEQNMFLIVIID